MLAIFTQRLTELFVSIEETYIPAPRRKGGSIKRSTEYGSSVWDLQGVVLYEELRSVQKRDARCETGNYYYETGSMTGILGYHYQNKKEEIQ